MIETTRVRSSDQQHQLYVKYWLPNAKPVAVIQLIHGMQEHIDRYHDFAIFLANQGFLVVGHDHLGHGKTAETKDELGFFAEKNGAVFVVKDVLQVREETLRRAPDLPYFMLGHSMGSLILRNYLSQYPEKELTGAIIMGSAFESPLKMTAALQVTSVLSPFRNTKWASRFLDTMVFAGHNRRFSPHRTTKDWLSSDTQQVDSYLQNEYTQFLFTPQAFTDLFHLAKQASAPTSLNKISASLPLLVISGEEDPVGGYGKQIKKLAASLKKAGEQDITLSLIAQGRHEILNEKNRGYVFQVILQWVQEKMPNEKTTSKYADS